MSLDEQLYDLEMGGDFVVDDWRRTIRGMGMVAPTQAVPATYRGYTGSTAVHMNSSELNAVACVPQGVLQSRRCHTAGAHLHSELRRASFIRTVCYGTSFTRPSLRDYNTNDELENRQ